MTDDAALWNFADVWEAVAETIPDLAALHQGSRTCTWGEADRRADGLAALLLDAGLGVQDRVGMFLHNCPEYIEATIAALKARLVPFNTNYRYRDEELRYLWDDADAAAVVFHGCFAARIEALRASLPLVKLWVWVDDGSGPCPSWATPYEDAAASGRTPGVVGPRPGTDLLLLYTGGTTGMPKGVMWEQHQLYRFFSTSALRDPEGADYDAVRKRLPGRRPVAMPACPLMHATGLFSALTTLFAGGSVVLLESRSFDAHALLDAIERHRVNRIAIVGDVFAQPIVAALDAEPDRWDIGSLDAVISAGVMLSDRSKNGLLRHQPKVRIVDTLGSSEAVGVGDAVTADGKVIESGRFALGRNARVIAEDGRDVTPGSGEAGMVAVAGFLPVGYHKDSAKTAATFRVIDGRRYSFPGDWATVEADGTLRLLGRGSQCINTGGEKVYPEEVEEVLKDHPAVVDAAVVGVPDPRLFRAVWAVVVAAAPFDQAEVLSYVRTRLAGYKVPKGIVVRDSLERGPNGKLDYRRMQQVAEAAAPTSLDA